MCSKNKHTSKKKCRQVLYITWFCSVTLMMSSSLGEKIYAKQLHWCLMLSSESLPCWTYNDNLSDLCNTNKNIWNANPGPKNDPIFVQSTSETSKFHVLLWCFSVHVGPSKPGLNLLHILQLILHCTGISTGERITPSNDIATFGDSSKSCMCRLNVLHVFPKASTLNAEGYWMKFLMNFPQQWTLSVK